jgi:hypothetical protein
MRGVYGNGWQMLGIKQKEMPVKILHHLQIRQQ